MIQSESKRLQTRAISDIKVARKKLEDATILFRVSGNPQLMEIWREEIIYIDFLLEQYTADISGLSIAKSKKDKTKASREQQFLTMWFEAFPTYGKPSMDDMMTTRDMLSRVALQYPDNCLVILKRGVQNFYKSTVDWTQSKTLRVFARNFPGYFLEKPELVNQAAVLDLTGSFSGLNNIE